jgi:hypothetical protein
MNHNQSLSLLQASIDLRYRLFAARLRRVQLHQAQMLVVTNLADKFPLFSDTYPQPKLD